MSRSEYRFFPMTQPAWLIIGVKSFLIGKGISEIIKRTALAAVFSAIALPATVYKTATKTLDNDFQRSTDRAQKAGIILADVLEKGVQGNRPTILVSEDQSEGTPAGGD